MDTDKLKEQVRAIPIPPGLGVRSRIGVERAAAERKRGGIRKAARRFAAGAAVLLAAVVLSAALASRGNVWAAIQKALQFVPGIGIVKEENAAVDRYVLKQPITVPIGGGELVITGMVSDNEMTYMTVAATGTAQFERVTVVNEKGAAYTLDRGGASWGSDFWTATFWTREKADVGGDVTLRLEMNSPIDVPARLDKAETREGYAGLGPTATANGVSITAVADRVGDKARVTLVTPPAEGQAVSDYGILADGEQGEIPPLRVADAQGQPLAITFVRGVASPRSEFYFPLEAGTAGPYSLTIPEIRIDYPFAEASVTIPIETGELNRTIEIAGFPVTFTRTERLEDAGLRVYLDTRDDERSPVSLVGFRLKNLSSMFKLNERTGAPEYMEFDVEPGAKRIKLELDWPTTAIRGPWTFELNP